MSTTEQPDSSTPWLDGLDHAAITDVGMRRANNQDNLRVVIAADEIQWKSQGHLFIVADGMGAHAAGEKASEMAVRSVPHHYQKYIDKSPPESLKLAISEANTEIHERGQSNAEFHNMGTTICVLTLLPQGALLGHVGDSRVYRFRANRIEQLTFDHSLVWEMKRHGKLKTREDEEAIPKNVITRSLGPNAEVEVDVEGPFPIQTGDTFLLCSDGLSGQVSDLIIGATLSLLDPETAAAFLRDLANLTGGPDNVTVIIAKVTGDQITTPPEDSGSFTVTTETDDDDTTSALFYTLGGVLALAGGVLAMTLGSQLPGLITLGLGLLSALTGFIKPMFSSNGTVSHKIGGQPFGEGPYSRTNCEITADVLNEIISLVKRVRQAHDRSAEQYDWQHFDELCVVGAENQQRGNFAAAFLQFSEAISFMMTQFRST